MVDGSALFLPAAKEKKKYMQKKKIKVDRSTTCHTLNSSTVNYRHAHIHQGDEADYCEFH